MSDIFREIDDELRRENLLKLWARYGRYIIAVAVLALAIAGVIAAWRSHQQSERQAQSLRYAGAVALASASKEADATEAFAAIAREGGGYGTLAGFLHAALLVKAGDRKGAAAAYDRLAASSALDPDLRDLARLLSVMYGFPDIPAKTAIARLEQLTANGNPWHSSAIELTAAARLELGDRKGALALYKRLADDLTAPEGLRARAAEMAAALAS